MERRQRRKKTVVISKDSVSGRRRRLRPSLRSRRAKRKQRVFSSRSCVQAAAAAAAGPARTALNRFLSPAIKLHGADALGSLLMRGSSRGTYTETSQIRASAQGVSTAHFSRFNLSAAIHCWLLPARRHPTWKVAAWRAALRLPCSSPSRCWWGECCVFISKPWTKMTKVEMNKRERGKQRGVGKKKITFSHNCMWW